jgi:hypothetical protein
VASLDLLSTSQKISVSDSAVASTIDGRDVSFELLRDIELELEMSRALQARKCENNAPYICYFASDIPRLMQGCCNSWTCPRCGQMRARAEYGKMVNGARELTGQGQTLYFLTLTCRGKEMTLDEAERGYLKWTNSIMTNIRAEAKRQTKTLVYAGVTERQKRGHPHSHIIINIKPRDAKIVARKRVKADRTVETRMVLESNWLQRRIVASGLGSQYELTRIRSNIGVAVYLSKYLFKDAIQTFWPRRWKRIRYSQSWPKLPDQDSGDAFPLVRLADWHKLTALDRPVYADDQVAYEAALARLIMCVVFNYA